MCSHPGSDQSGENWSSSSGKRKKWNPSGRWQVESRHDFNNLLTVILSYSSYLSEELRAFRNITEPPSRSTWPLNVGRR